MENPHERLLLLLIKPFVKPLVCTSQQQQKEDVMAVQGLAFPLLK